MSFYQDHCIPRLVFYFLLINFIDPSERYNAKEIRANCPGGIETKEIPRIRDKWSKKLVNVRKTVAIRTPIGLRYTGTQWR